MPQPLDDEQLATRVRDGERTLWRELAEQVTRMIAPAVAHKVRLADREDVTQDSLVRFFKALPDYDQARGKLSTFVAVLTQRQIADYYRSRGKDPDTADIEELADILEEGSAYANPGPDLMPELKELAAEDWPLIEMRLDGYKWDEVAVKVGTTVAAAKMRMRRALDRMRDYLEKADG